MTLSPSPCPVSSNCSLLPEPASRSRSRSRSPIPLGFWEPQFLGPSGLYFENSGFSISNLAPSPAHSRSTPAPPVAGSRVVWRSPSGAQRPGRPRPDPGGGRGQAAAALSAAPGLGPGAGIRAGLGGELTSKRAAAAGRARGEGGCAGRRARVPPRFYLRAGPRGGRASCRRLPDRVGEWERGPNPSPRK